jgi:NTP pyrophosphatase (non-canonical NTP hydrolase)
VSDLTKEQKEIFCITQEECAEVTQAISKIFRFGINSEHNGVTNIQRLEEEVGDLLAMVSLLKDKKIINEDNVTKYIGEKMTRLKTWSSIEF